MVTMDRNRRKRVKMVTASALGPVSYLTGGGNYPTMTVTGVRTIESIADIQMWAPGYIVDPVSVAGNIISYRIRSVHDAHSHILKSSAGAPAANAVTMAANSLHNASAGALTISADLGTEGVMDAAASITTIANQQAIEVPDTSVLNGVTFRALVLGMV